MFTGSQAKRWRFVCQGTVSLQYEGERDLVTPYLVLVASIWVLTRNNSFRPLKRCESMGNLWSALTFLKDRPV